MGSLGFLPLLRSPIHKRCRTRIAGAAQLHRSARLQAEPLVSPLDSERGEAIQSGLKSIKDARDDESKASSPTAKTRAASSVEKPNTSLKTFRTVPPLPPRLQKALEEAQSHVDKQYANLKTRSDVLRKTLAARAKVLGKEAEVRFNALGGTINEVTGYREVEKLKEQLEIARLREVAAKAKITYDEAVATRDTAQRSVTSLLERKHQWTDSDVHQFTSLVRTDHTSNLTVAQSKVSLLEAEANVEKAFDDMMKAILERYHEEQVWSDKIRSVSTYGSLAVLVVNLIVFISAILIVEPWKRKKLVRGLEEKVSGMMEKVEGHLARDLESVKSLLAVISLAGPQGESKASRTVVVPGVLRESMVGDTYTESAIPAGSMLEDIAGSPESSISPPAKRQRLPLATPTSDSASQSDTAASRFQHLATVFVSRPLHAYLPSASKYIEENPRTVETVATGLGGVLGGVALTSVLGALLRSR